MKYIVAVSGGVDSVVLLDMIQKRIHSQIIVAHFDHGIRKESEADARFVEALAKQYQLPFQLRREELGSSASEELARNRRYEFLHKLAAEHEAKLITAHHQDDLVETVAHNFVRGTGWRGLAVFGDTRILRPLIAKTKNELYEYALNHNLEWVEDETNRQDTYTRNRLRKQLSKLSSGDKKAVFTLYYRQHELAARIHSQLVVTQDKTRSRYFMTMIDELVALELLRHITNGALTRPQLQRLLLAIKTYRAGTVCEAGSGVVVRFTQRNFIVETTP